jgi:hypothetical protein
MQLGATAKTNRSEEIQVRVLEERQTYFGFEDTDEAKPTIGVSCEHLKRPMTTVPESLTVKWKKGLINHGGDIGWWDSGVWEIWDVFILARRIKSTSHENVMITYGPIPGNRAGERPWEELPSWAAALVAESYPGY